MANEIDLEALKGLEELAGDIGSKMQTMMTGVTASGNKLVDKLVASSRETLNFRNALEDVFEIMRKSGDLPKGFLIVEDLQRGMLKDAKLFQKVQKSTTKLMNEGIAEVRDTVNDLNTELDDTSEVFESSLMTVKEAAEDITQDFDTQFKLLKRQAEAADKLSANFEDVKGIVDDIGSVIRSPAKGAEGFLATVSQLPKKFMEAKEETGSMSGALGKVWGDSRMGKFVKMVGKGGPIVLGLAAITAAAVVVWALFKNYWDFMDKKVIPAVADFNKQIGGSGAEVEKLKGQTIAMGVQFDLLGLSFEEGAAKVRELALGMRTVEFDRETLKTGVELVSILGLSGDQAGRAAIQFQKQTGNLDGLNEMLNAGAKEAKAWGVPVNQVLQDLAGAPDILARFGVTNRMEFAKSATVASSYGLSIREINAAFGKQMDTFDGTAESAAKLNTIFGTNINSMELMMETDPTKRMQMLRKELVAQGKEWDSLSVFEKNVVTQTLGVDEAQAALMLSSDKQRKKLERLAKAKKADQKTNERWTKGINSMKRTLIAWGAVLDKVMRSVANLLSRLLGFDSAADPVKEIAKAAEKAALSFSKWADDVDWDTIENIQTLFKDIKDDASAVWGVLKIGHAVLKDALIAPMKILDKVISNVAENFDILLTLFKDFATGNISGGLKKAWGSHVDGVKDFFSVFGDLGSNTGKALFGGKSVDDALITSAGKVIELNPNDNVLAFQDFQKLLPKSAVSGEAQHNVAPTELRVLTQAVQRLTQASSVGGMGGSQKPEVIQVNLHLDGKKISESQVRISRNA